MREMREYKARARLKPDAEDERPVQKQGEVPRQPRPNPDRITRLFLKNMCAKRTNECRLLEVLSPARVTHIQWLLDRRTGKFYGSAFIEVKSQEDAGLVLALNGAVVLGRTLIVKYQKADEKDVWPIPKTEVSSRS